MSYVSGSAIVVLDVLHEARVGLSLAHVYVGETQVTASVPGAPSFSLNQLPANASQTVTLNWAAPEYTGGAPVTAYRVYVGTSAILSGTQATLSSAISEPTPGNFTATYANYPGWAAANGAGLVVVRAVNAVGVGPPSVQRPTFPQNALLYNVGDEDNYVFAWDAPALDFGSPITAYYISVGGEIVATLPASARQYRFFLSPDSANYGDWFMNAIEVIAGNAGGFSDANSLPIMQGDVRPATPPAAPTVFDQPLTMVNNSTELLFAAPEFTGGSPVPASSSGYRYYVDGVLLPANGFSVVAGPYPHNGALRSYLAQTGGAILADKEVQIAAVNAVGEGEKSAPIIAQ